MCPELRIALLKHPQQDIFVKCQHRTGLSADHRCLQPQLHIREIIRNYSDAARNHVQFDSMERRAVGNRFQELDDPLRLVNLNLIIQRFVGGNHLFPIRKVARQRFALPLEIADHDAEQPLVPATPDMQRTRFLRLSGQQRQRKRQRHILRDFQRTRQIEQLFTVRCGHAVTGEVDPPQRKPCFTQIHHRSRQRQQPAEIRRQFNRYRVIRNGLRFQPVKQLAGHFDLAAARGTDQLTQRFILNRELLHFPDIANHFNRDGFHAISRCQPDLFPDTEKPHRPLNLHRRSLRHHLAEHLQRILQHTLPDLHFHTSMMLKHSGSGGLTTAGASNEQDYPDYTEVIYK